MLRGDLVPWLLMHYARERVLHFYARQALSHALANEKVDLYFLADFELMATAQQMHKGIDATRAIISGEAFDEEYPR